MLLRYEHDIVALVPDGHGGTTIERHGADEGYRRFYAYVGSYWGERYSSGDDAPRSAMRTDAERRFENQWRAIPIAIVRVGAIFTLAFLFFGLIAAAIARLVRRVRT